MIHVLSLGAGVQSSTLALMAARSEVGPMPDLWGNECEGMCGVWTCASCRWSVMHWRGVLWCSRDNQAARRRCEAFEYEPGTDESEAQR